MCEARSGRSCHTGRAGQTPFGLGERSDHDSGWAGSRHLQEAGIWRHHKCGAHVFLGLLFACELSSCSPDGVPVEEAQYPAKIVGTWQGTVGDRTETISFDADGRFVSQERRQGFIPLAESWQMNILNNGPPSTIRGGATVRKTGAVSLGWCPPNRQQLRQAKPDAELIARPSAGPERSFRWLGLPLVGVVLGVNQGGARPTTHAQRHLGSDCAKRLHGPGKLIRSPERIPRHATRSHRVTGIRTCACLDLGNECRTFAELKATKT